MSQRWANPIADGRRLLARRQQVGRGHNPVLAGERQDLGRLIAAHELRGAQMQEIGLTDGVPGGVGRRVAGVGPHHVKRGTGSVRPDGQDAGRCLYAASLDHQRSIDPEATQ